MTKKYLSILSLLAAGTPGLAQQQQQMYVCQADTCHVFSLEHTNGIVFRADSFQIGQLPAYATARVDSITFSEPPLAVVPLGWWGNMANGQCSYRSLMDIRLQKDDVHTLVVFTMECRDSICLAARCELYFDDEEIAQAFVLSEGESEDPSSQGESEKASSQDGGDPYIYVKQTQTGPRKFEVWVMYNPVLPDEPEWAQDGACAYADCTPLLTGRPMADVRQIVEAWLHQEGTKIKKQNNP